MTRNPHRKSRIDAALPGAAQVQDGEQTPVVEGSTEVRQAAKDSKEPRRIPPAPRTRKPSGGSGPLFGSGN
jgi:hypothetical protein